MKAGLVGLACLSLFSASANAQPPPGTPMAGQPQSSELDRARTTMAAFARCVLNRLPQSAEAALKLPIGRDFQKSAEQLARSGCLFAGTLRFQAMLLRGALFAELWRRRAPGGGSTALPDLGPPQVDASTASLDAVQRQHAALLMFAGCVIKRDPETASEAVIKPTASVEQDDALRRLAPQMSGCIPPGTQLRLSKPVVEGALAEMLYRTVGTVTPVP